MVKRGLCCLLGGLLIAATLSVGSHRHADGAVHGDCPVCVTGQHQAIAASDSPSGLVCPEAVVPTDAGVTPRPFASAPSSTIRGRAPPR